MNNNKLHISLAVMFVVALFMIGCDGSSDIINPPTDNEYTVAGVLVQDLNLGFNGTDYNFAALTFTKNSSDYDSIEVALGSSLLAQRLVSSISDSVYSFTNSPRSYMDSGNYTVTLVDGSDFSGTFSLILPDTVRINSYNPDSTTTYTASNSGVVVEWTSSQNGDGYVVACVKASNAYSKSGYSSFVTTLATSDNIPHDAFLDQFDQLDTGLYYIYVYSYTGAPDSAYSAGLLPVPLPAQLSNNISQTNLTGHIGSVVVCRRVPIYVQEQ